MKKLFIIITIILMPAIALANFSIKFENTSNKKMIYILYWLDHPFDSLRPASLAGGELRALESRNLSYNYKFGRYCVIWKDGNGQWRHEMFMEIKDDVSHITITPDHWSSEKQSPQEFDAEFKRM